MKPIELFVPASLEDVIALLAGISQTSLFAIEPDGLRRSSSRKVAYQILFYPEGAGTPELVGLLEVTRSRQKVTTVKIIDRYLSQHETLPGTGALLTRFVSLFAQNMMFRGIEGS